MGVSTEDTDLADRHDHHTGKTNILPHVFQGLGVVCGADTNSQDTREEDSAKSGGISRGLNDNYFKGPDVKPQKV